MKVGFIHLIFCDLMQFIAPPPLAGYQLVSLKGELAERGTVERMSCLNQQQLTHYCDMDGRALDPAQLRQRIFKGGLHPGIRSELWCCLLNYYPWDSSRSERLELNSKKRREYEVLKQQWSSVTEDQEMRFTGFRDRKSLIGG